MTFDQTVLWWCVIAPVLVLLAAMLVARLVNGGLAARGAAASAVIAFGWCIAVWVAVTARQGWQWFPDESWRQSLWPLLAWAGWTICLDEDSDRPGPWVVAGVLATWTAMTAVPGGENWQDTFPFHRTWMTAITTSCLVNAWSGQRMAISGAGRWLPLVAVASLGGPTILAASTYASLAECGVAAISASAVIALIGVTGKIPRLYVVVFPAFALAAGMTAAGRFYSYEEHPKAIYAAMLFLPTWVAIADWPLRRRSNGVRVATAATISAGIVAACLWFLLLREA